MSDTHVQAATAAIRNLVEGTHGPLPPAAVLEFLVHHWRRYLFLVHRNHGGHGTAWTDAVRVGELLLWSVIPKTTADDRSRLTAALDTLLADLKHGMTAIHMTEAEQETFLGGLADLHLDAMHVAHQASGTTGQAAGPNATDLDNTISLDVRDPKYAQLIDLLKSGNVEQIDV
jgi:hypothetical protein